MGKLTVVGHPRAAGLRRAIGLLLVAGLCVSAVTFYRDAELPRSAPSMAGGTPSTASPPTVGASSASPSPTTTPKPAPTIAPVKTKLPKGPGTTEPGILLMASPLRDGSFDVAEIVLLATPTSSIRLGPPRAGAGRKPLCQGQAGCLSDPGQRREPAGDGPWWSCQPAHEPCTGRSCEEDRVAVQPEGNHHTQHPLARRPCADCHQSLGRRCSQDSPGRTEDQRQHRAQYRVPRPTAARSGMFRWTCATPARQSKAAVAQRSDCCPVRPAETAMRLAARQWWTG